jgi:hypothetical protein
LPLGDGWLGRSIYGETSAFILNGHPEATKKPISIKKSLVSGIAIPRDAYI